MTEHNWFAVADHVVMFCHKQWFGYLPLSYSLLVAIQYPSCHEIKEESQFGWIVLWLPFAKLISHDSVRGRQVLSILLEHLL